MEMSTKDVKKTGGLFRRPAFAVLLALTLALPVAQGCKGGDKKPADKKEAAKADENKPLATLASGRTITLKEVDAFWKDALPDMQKMQFMQLPDWKKKILEEYLSIVALAEVAKKEGLEDNEDFKADMERLKMKALAQLYFEKKMKPEIEKTKADPKDIDAFYAKNKDKMFYTGWRMASQIVVKTKGEADKLYTQLGADPSKFAEVAKTKSIDQATAPQGGDLGKVTKSDTTLPPEVINTVFTTAKGKVSLPSESRNGWHIFYIKEASIEDYTALDDNLRKQLVPQVESQKKQDRLKSLVEAMKKEMKIKIEDKNISRIGEAWTKEMEKMMMQQQGHGGMPPSQMPKAGGHEGMQKPAGH